MIGAGIIAPSGIAAETKPSAQIVSAKSDTGAVVDSDGDKFSDLVVGVPFKDGTTYDAGRVHVLYGSVNGLTVAGSEVWTQNSPQISGDAGESDFFGLSLAAANFGKDPNADLAIGVPSEDVSGIAEAGGVHVIYGAANGLTAASGQFWTQNSPGITDSAEVSTISAGHWLPQISVRVPTLTLLSACQVRTPVVPCSSVGCILFTPPAQWLSSTAR